MSRITDYQTTSRVTADDALHDKVEVTLGDWFENLFCPSESIAEAFDSFTNHLAVPPESIRQSAERWAEHGIVFTRPSGRASNYRRLRFRRQEQRTGQGETTIPPMLPNGFLETKLRRFGDSTHSAPVAFIECKCNAKLNATTYMRQKRTRRRAASHLAPRPDIFAQSLPSSFQGEYSFDGKANWLPRNARGEVAWTTAQSLAAVCDFVEGVQARIAHEITRATGEVRSNYARSMAEVVRESANVVEQVETYFEFFHRSPLQLVESIQEAANAYARRAEVAFFDIGTEGQSRRILMELFKGVYLRIYAKTNQRIRFEIQHNLSEANRPFDASQSFGNRAELGAILSTLRTDAAELVNRFLATLNPTPVHESQQHAPLSLVLEVCRAARNYEDAKMLLDALCVNTRIDSAACPSLRPALLRLKESGVIRARRYTTIYTATREWQTALQTLAEQTRLAAITLHPVMRRLQARARPPIAGE